MTGETLTILVEGPTDEEIVFAFIVASGISRNQVRVTVCRSKPAIVQRISRVDGSPGHLVFALIDADGHSVHDSREIAREQLGNPSIPVFAAVPTIEAWLFADDKLARANARSDHARDLLERIPLPELIPYPKQLAANVFKRGLGGNRFPFLNQVDVSRATSRSPSLRVFIESVAAAVGADRPPSLLSLGSSISRDVISTILLELPGSEVVWRTLEGTEVQAREMAVNVQEGADVGKQYASELLRVARDLIARKAKARR